MPDKLMIKSMCPVSGLTKITYPDWLSKTFGTNYYKVSIYLLGENIILSEISGDNNLETASKRLEFIRNIVQEHCADQSYFMLEDYKNFTKASKKSKQYYINYQKNNKALKAVIFFNASIYMKIMLKIGKSIGLAKFPVEIVDDYQQAINLVFLIEDNKSIPGKLPDKNIHELIVGGKKLTKTKKDDWMLNLPDYEMEFQLLGVDILFSRAKGIVKTEYLDQIFALQKRVLHETNLDTKGYYRVADWTDLKRISMKTQQEYKKQYQKLLKKTGPRANVVFGINAFMKTIITISNPFLTSPILIANTFDEALNIIEEKRGKEYKTKRLGRSDRQTQKYAQELLQFMGDINWDTRGKVSEVIKKNHPFKTVFDAIAIVKDDIDYLFEENRKANLKQKLLFDTANDAILVIEKDCCVDCNETSLKLFGYDNKDEIIGKKPLDFAPLLQPDGQKSEFLAKKHRTAAQSNNSTVFEWAGKKKNGEIIFTEVTLNYFEFQGEKSLQVTSRDISSRKKAESIELERLKIEIASKAKSVFLNNSGQGFLSFGPDLLINREYSLECENIFNCSVTGESIAALLYPVDEKERAAVETNFINVLSEDDDYTQELYLSLLKKEYQVGTKFVKAEYKIIDKKNMMLILTDISLHKELENKVYNEHKRLKFVVSAVQESNYFFEILNDFTKFYKNGFQKIITTKNTSAKTVAELYRNIHTFKGLFGQQEFLYIPGALHKLEDHLSKLLEKNSLDISEFTDIMNLYRCREELDKDLAIIEQILGKEFLEQKERRQKISISRGQAEKIEAMAHKLINSGSGFIDAKTRDFLLEIKKIQNVNLKSLIEFHLSNAVKLAQRLGKEVNCFAVQGDDIFINSSIYAPFTRTLVHVFRNAVDHGIETPEEREKLDKEEDARLICSIKEIKKSSQIIISVSDNGKGLDTSKIRNKVVELGIFTKEEVLQFSDEKIHHLIFNENFSTSETVTELSGRGVGLDSVKTELSKLKGDLEITTEPGKGTTFRFIIPVK